MVNQHVHTAGTQQHCGNRQAEMILLQSCSDIFWWIQVKLRKSRTAHKPTSPYTASCDDGTFSRLRPATSWWPPAPFPPVLPTLVRLRIQQVKLIGNDHSDGLFLIFSEVSNAGVQLLGFFRDDPVDCWIILHRSCHNCHNHCNHLLKWEQIFLRVSSTNQNTQRNRSTKQMQRKKKCLTRTAKRNVFMMLSRSSPVVNLNCRWETMRNLLLHSWTCETEWQILHRTASVCSTCSDGTDIKPVQPCFWQVCSHTYADQMITSYSSRYTIPFIHSLCIDGKKINRFQWNGHGHPAQYVHMAWRCIL